jgi:photosystem II stability/assembly factor-like uncharacterized protein
MRLGLLVCFTLLLSTSLSAQQWMLIEETANTGRFDDITFINNDLGFYITSGGEIHRTTDGGMSWELSFHQANEYLRAVEFIDDTLGFVSGLAGSILKTEDGGETWNDISDQIDGLATAICGFDHVGNTIWGVGIYAYPAVLIKSTDRGETWTIQQLDSLADGLVEVYFQDEQTGYIGGVDETEGGVLLKTTDGGDSWTNIFTSSVPADYIWKIFPVNADTIYASVETFTEFKTSIIRSYDGGETWSEHLVSPLLLDIQGIGFINGQTGWVSPRNEYGYVTHDGGDNWEQQLDTPNNINRFVARPDGTLFASGSGIYYLSTDTVTSTTNNYPEFQASSQLEIFPNPVKTQLNYTLSLSQATNCRIDLYASDGRHLANLWAGRRQAGTYTGEYQLPRQLPQGNLLLTLRCDDTMNAFPVIRQ